jgi:hypothetical protein
MAKDTKHVGRIAALMIGHYRGILSEEETFELKMWCAQSADNQALFDKISDPDYVKDYIKDLPDMQALKSAGWDKLDAMLSKEDPEW